jgi:thiol-disulfide isomerase/thioredoxin
VLRAAAARANDLRIGAPAPAATLVTLDGRSISTTELVGQVVILTFWATWCVPCREELPLLSEYAQKHAAQGLTVLGFGLDTPDRIADVRKVAEGLRFPVGFLASSRAPGYGRIWRLPVNFTIDRAGRLAEDGWKEKAPSWTPERLEQVVTPLLG